MYIFKPMALIPKFDLCWTNKFICEGNGISNGWYIASLHPVLGQKVQDKIEEKAAALELIFNLTEA